MRKNNFLFYSICIFILCAAIACGKKNTWIQNPEQSGYEVINPSTPNSMGGGNSPGGNEGSGSEPNPGGADPAGGEIISDEIGTIYSIMANEDHLKKWFSETINFFIYGYGIFHDENDLIYELFTKIDKQTHSQCFERTKNLNLEYKEKMITPIYSNVNEYEVNRKMEIAHIESILLRPKHKNTDEFLEILWTETRKNDYLVSEYKKRSIDLNCENSFHDFLKTIRFDLRRYSSCDTTSHLKTSFPNEKKTKDATYSLQNNKHTICVSIPDLAKKLTGSTESHIVGLIMHEISHAFGYDEIDAVSIQNYFLTQSQNYIFNKNSNQKKQMITHLAATQNISRFFWRFLLENKNILRSDNSEKIDSVFLKNNDFSEVVIALETTRSILNANPEEDEAIMSNLPKNARSSDPTKIKNQIGFAGLLRIMITTIYFKLLFLEQSLNIENLSIQSDSSALKYNEFYSLLTRFIELNALFESLLINEVGYYKSEINVRFRSLLPLKQPNQ